ncbi:MAG: nicotinate-nicotinamide nucleotide adenylyltransferase [Bdellovibrionales bacterium]|nr:nicotinate-nicotinamide nucleotide adenylyltransferase [Bdellovibrionales bacterium]
MGRGLWFLGLFLFLGSLPVFASGPVDCSFLLAEILKNSRHDTKAISSLSDLSLTEAPSFPLLVKKINEKESKEKRFQAISELLLDQVIAAPGHRFLRKPDQIEGLAKYIRENQGGNFQHDKILINIITHKDGKIKSVDLWNAHHRFLAYRLAGYEKIGDLNFDNIEILVDGVHPSGESWVHYLPAAGIDLSKRHDYGVVPHGGDIRIGTISLSGRISNYELGARNTIGQLMINTMREYKPKVGVYFGTFDPIHEGHIKVAKMALESEGLDEVLVVPNLNSIEKPNAIESQHRIQMAAIRIKKEEGLNLYIKNSVDLIDQFGRDPFFERVEQIYGTKQIYQVIGQDSFEKLIRQGEILPNSNRIYLVSPRQGNSESITIPENLKKVVTIIRADKGPALSSTDIRNKIGTNTQIKRTELDPELLDYIQRNGLYKK